VKDEAVTRSTKKKIITEQTKEKNTMQVRDENGKKKMKKRVWMVHLKEQSG
jgi:hypothetical protein